MATKRLIRWDEWNLLPPNYMNIIGKLLGEKWGFKVCRSILYNITVASLQKWHSPVVCTFITQILKKKTITKTCSSPPVEKNKKWLLWRKSTEKAIILEKKKVVFLFLEFVKCSSYQGGRGWAWEWGACTRRSANEDGFKGECEGIGRACEPYKTLITVYCFIIITINTDTKTFCSMF